MVEGRANASPPLPQIMTCIFPLGKCYDLPSRSAMARLIVGHRPFGSAIGPAQVSMFPSLRRPILLDSTRCSAPHAYGFIHPHLSVTATNSASGKLETLRFSDMLPASKNASRLDLQELR
ncbi:hypothetical protein MPTK1_8g13240 [Marchantia polymorpha subsp. ruderalis]|uniref:Uncharacterized protein n=1 Tax=Marchantia polymorpha TaxID=3197 RepID=A0A2R6WCC5_MARPO|nr:hypothetical protein MARPO_0110s0005 [Marchantia polymorpha]BBN19744.1 hypothetical protein Mp_8g13240 [Marchantia polymorpha subsp. ruderalis]|eukprot:PTQ31511.1 hypothetical protein MARPO_0110s0005 [Marchantia polymorpha]